ncbi:MAG TPA: hypothetical protein VNH13_07240 [Candidatus Acidoferrales bacterium]|nr:hypothetical protein [Candidatus Acidoferrales bacterium]
MDDRTRAAGAIRASFADAWGSGSPEPDAAPAKANEAYLELIGTHLRAAGVVDMRQFRRVTDYVNLLDGFFALRDVVLLTRTGESTRITMPELRVRLDDVAIIGQLAAETLPRADEFGVHVEKVTQRLVIMTRAHIIYGYVYLHAGASLMAFIDSTDPKFIPMSRVRVRWLADRRLAARYPFALVQRSLILGVATEGTGAPKEARARRRAAIAEAEAHEAAAGEGSAAD